MADLVLGVDVEKRHCIRGMILFFALAAWVHGQVREAGASGGPLASVLVSNGSLVVATDATGQYRLPVTAETRFVFVIKPTGFLASPWFRALPAEEANFFLSRHPEPDQFEALVFTDPQPSNPREVEYLTRSLTAPLAATGAGGRYQFGITCGDVTYDRSDLYPAINASLRRLGVPWFNVNGNHDLNLGVAGEDAVQGYEQTYGPSTYAFYWGGTLLVAVNDVRHQGGPRYRAGLLPAQWSLLDALLNAASPETPVVLYFHIPLFNADPLAGSAGFPRAERDRLFTLLKRFHQPLLLSGHTHTVRHVKYGAADGWHGPRPLEEYNIAAACGGFWGGPVDASGAPISTMADGTPPGYAVLRVAHDGFDVQYRLRPDLADSPEVASGIALHVPRVVAPRQSYVMAYASVFDGGEDWTVTAQFDQRAPVAMRPTLAEDPAYLEAYLAQDQQAVPLATPRLPEPGLCFHLWKLPLPADLPRGKHQITVEAAAPDGRRLTHSASFAVADPR